MLTSDLARFSSEAGRGEWAVVWAAGSGVVASTREELRAETAILSHFASAVRRHLPQGRGAFLLASSAGGVYAGSSSPPFDEETAPCPLGVYGEAKLEQENLVTATLGDAVPVIVARLSNLYGPGQDLAKPQGLVSHLCLAAATRQALNLFVPMDTSRDYLYVDDAAQMIVALVASVVRRQPDRPDLRILASGRPTSVSSLLRTVQLVAHRPIRVALGHAPSSERHARDVRFRSAFSDHITRTATTPLPRVANQVAERTHSPLSGTDQA